MGSFANLNLTAEKIVKERLKTELDMVNLKLKMSTDYIHGLEEKLHSAINEKDKLQVKQKEDSKLWKGLESKFSSTKALCDQLTETLQQLASLVRDAEQDKKLFEDKFSASGDAFDSLQLQFSSLTMKLKSAEDNLRTSEEQIAELRTEKDEKEKAYVNEHNKISKLIEEKDSLVKGLEEDIAAEKLQLENLTFALDRMQPESQRNDNICGQLRVTLDNAPCLHITTENAGFKSEIEDLKRKIIELQKGQELLISQHADECRLREEKIENLEFEFGTLLSKEPWLDFGSLRLLVPEAPEPTKTDIGSLVATMVGDEGRRPRIAKTLVVKGSGPEAVAFNLADLSSRLINISEWTGFRFICSQGNWILCINDAIDLIFVNISTEEIIAVDPLPPLPQGFIVAQVQGCFVGVPDIAFPPIVTIGILSNSLNLMLMYKAGSAMWIHHWVPPTIER